MNQRTWTPILLVLLLLLGGCLTKPPTSTPGSTIHLDPEQYSDVGLYAITVGSPVPLPGPLSDEPSIAVSSDGVIAVAGNAGWNSSPTVYTEAGYVWISNDNGTSFELRLNPKPLGQRSGTSCSCDTDVLAIGIELFTTAMHSEFILPRNNANIVASIDSGYTWEARSIFAADSEATSIDRPWLAEGPRSELMLLYDDGGSYAPRTDGEKIEPEVSKRIILKISTDGGATWGKKTEIATVTATQREEIGEDYSYLHHRPSSIQPSTIIVPLTYTNETIAPLHENRVAISHDSGNTFQIVTISEPRIIYNVFDLSLDTLSNGRVVAAWTARDEEGVNKLHVRESSDSGDTWSTTVKVEFPGNMIQPWVALREDGLVAVAHYGTDAQEAMRDIDPVDTPWYPRVALLDPDDSGAPVAVVNLTSEPTFKGFPCNFGSGCPQGVSRLTPMREFLSAEWGPQGSLFTVFVDARESPSNGDTVGRVTVTPVHVERSL